MPASHNYRTIAPVHLWRTMHTWHMPTHQRTSFGSSRPTSAFSQWYFWISLYMAVQPLTTASFDSAPRSYHEHHDYWPFAREYSIWNAVVATLWFWTADLETHILNSAIEWVHATFVYTTSMHLPCNQPEEVLFGHFMTTLNDAFERELPIEDDGYESGSKTSNLPTPLRRTSRIHHISSNENISFDLSTPCTTATSQSNCKPVHFQLLFSSSDNKDISAVHSSSHTSTSLPLNSMGFATIQVHLHHMWWLHRRRRFPNSCTRWWPLDYRSSSR